jgi:hypothetical protein
MKPDFALKLSHEAIGLLSRADGGWHLLDEVAMSDPALDAALARLRDRAAQTAGGTFQTKLLLPEAEVLFATVDAPGPTDAERAAQVRAAIEGLTSYSLEELAFDWVPAPDDAGKAHVALAARFILDEAEAFAHAHQFDPVSFAAPAPGPFAREPFFGETGVAAALIGAGTRVIPDTAPLRILPPQAPEAPTPPEAAADAADVAQADTPAAENTPVASPDAKAPAKAPPVETAPVGTAPEKAPEPAAATKASDPAPDAAPKLPDAAPPTPPAAVVPTSAPVPEKLAAVLRKAEGAGPAPAASTGVAMPAALAKAAIAAKASGIGATALRAERPAAPAAPPTGGLARKLGGLIPGAARRDKADAPRSASSPAEPLGPREADPRAETAPTRDFATDPVTPPAPDASETARLKTVFDNALPAPEKSGGDGAAKPVIFASRRAAPGGASQPAADAAPARIASIAAPVAAQPAALKDAASPAKARQRPPQDKGAPAPAKKPASKRNGAGAAYYGTAKGEPAGGDDTAPAPSGPAPADSPALPRGTAVAGLAASAKGVVARASAAIAALPRGLGRRRAADTPRDPAALSEVIAAPLPVATRTGETKRSAPRRAPQPMAADGTVSEAEALTVFGARRQATPASAARGTGLILTGALVLVLAAVALWSVFFLRDDPSLPPDADTAAAPAPGIAAPDAIAAAPQQVPQDAAPGVSAPDISGFDPETGLAELLPAPDPATSGPFNIDEPIAEALSGVPQPPALTAPAPQSEAAARVEALTPDLAPEADAPAAEDAPQAAITDAIEAAVADALAPDAIAPDTPAPDTPVEPAPDTTAAVPVDTAPPTGGEAPAETAAAPPLPEPDMSPEALIAAYPETGIWPFAPTPADAPASRRLDDLFLAGRDVASAGGAIDPLPQAGDSLRDAVPRAPAPPPAFEDLAALLPGTPPPASAEGSPAAQGVIVTAGRPAIVPPLRADTLPPVPVFGANVPEIPTGIRPQPRPDSLVPPDAAPAPDDAAPGDQGALSPPATPDAGPETGTGGSTPETDVAAAPATADVAAAATLPVTGAPRPLPRPSSDPAATGSIGLAAFAPARETGTDSPQDDGTSEDTAGADAIAARSILPQPRPAALVAAAAAIAAPPSDSFEDATENAVARSVVPNRRPAGFAQLAVQRQAAAAAAAAAATQASAAVAAPPPASAAPSVPTRASVAEQATETRAINLRNTNLLGVFGTSSNRRALVRLPGGSVVSVRVGDRIEGSQVTAIGESELRYGRNGVLRIGG